MNRRLNRPKVNEKLKKLRLNENSWTFQQLAKEAGVSAQTVSKAERGENITDVSKSKIAKALRVNIEEIFPEVAG